MKILKTLAASLALFATPAIAQGVQPYIGANIGYQSIDDQGYDDLDTGAILYGLYAGVQYAEPDNILVGLEANYALGSKAVDSVFGLTTNIGGQVGDNVQLFARAGWVWYDLDLDAIFDIDGLDDAFNDSDDGWLLGFGGNILVSDTVFIRATADTVEFDTIGGTLGVGLRF